VGLTAAGNREPGRSGDHSDSSPGLEHPLQQNSYALAVPQFGGFDATAGATVGFAILSDIEAYFFINAAQGDKRTNVLQAPKVTLFNGQQAFVSDTSQTPFVISVVPVVGDFAAAQQPVIVVLSEGTFMTVQAVVSNDRRFVRLTVVPFFSKIGNVQHVHLPGFDTTTTNTHAQSASSSRPQRVQQQPGTRNTNTHSGEPRSSCRPSPSSP
jgi:general secretion pathway protein D